MTLEQLFQEMRYQVRDLFDGVFPERPPSAVQDRIDRLQGERRDCFDRLRRQYRVIDHLRQRIHQDERRADLLSARVEKSLAVGDRGTAWRDALELDQLRRATEQDRKQLRNHERTARAHQDEIDKIDRHLTDLRYHLHVHGYCRCA